VTKFNHGPHLVPPLISSVQRLSTKTKLLEQSNFIPTEEGLTVELDTAILYKLDPSRTQDLLSTVGTSFAKTLVEPEASSAVRGLTSESEIEVRFKIASSKNLSQVWVLVES
jgi:hypothetical protein